jgi:hypothetical protein
VVKVVGRMLDRMNLQVLEWAGVGDNPNIFLD